MDEYFNDMLGLTEQEVNEIIEYYKIGEITDIKILKKVLLNFCDGYKFNKNIENSIYNTDMVLYILKSLIQKKEYPEELIDANIKTDYKRLRNIAEKLINREEIETLSKGEKIEAVQIKERFNLESLYLQTYDNVNTRSLLYYLGMLTIKGKNVNKAVLVIPNIATKELYWEYIIDLYEIKNYSNYDQVVKAIEEMRLNKNLEPFIQQYEKLINNISTADLKNYNELTSKVIFISLLFIDGIYLMESEKETNGGRSDLYIKENYLYGEHVKYRYMIEFKHIKMQDVKGDAVKETREEIIEKNKEKIEELKQDALNQMETYIKDYGVIYDSEKELVRVIIITIGQKYVLKYIIGDNI
jgi:hypothetical protein